MASILFAFTVKYNKGEAVDDSDYYRWFDNARKCECNILKSVSEKDSKGRLHYHGVMSVPRSLYRKRLSMSGFHFKLVELYDAEGWDVYIMKQQDPDLIDDDPAMCVTINKKLF